MHEENIFLFVPNVIGKKIIDNKIESIASFIARTVSQFGLSDSCIPCMTDHCYNSVGMPLLWRSNYVCSLKPKGK